MIDLEILMTPFATWGVIIAFIVLVGCLTWIFERLDTTFRDKSQEDEHDEAR